MHSDELLELEKQYQFGEPIDEEEYEKKFLYKEKDSSNLRRLNKLLKENETQKKNLFDGLKICNIDAVACDLHPQFFTTKLAYEFGVDVIPVQPGSRNMAKKDLVAVRILKFLTPSKNPFLFIRVFRRHNWTSIIPIISAQTNRISVEFQIYIFIIQNNGAS